jgi:CCR4-NOT transcription complex subunit 9
MYSTQQQQQQQLYHNNHGNHLPSSNFPQLSSNVNNINNMRNSSFNAPPGFKGQVSNPIVNTTLNASSENPDLKGLENDFNNINNNSIHNSNQQQHQQQKDLSFQQDAFANQNLSIVPNRHTSDDDKVFTWILELMHGPNREQALLELGKKREQYEDLALILWHSFGVMTCLIQEIIYVYPLLSPPQLTPSASNRVCNALALLQCIASHDSTRKPFLNAHIPLFLYPFLNTTSKSRSFEYLRLTSLGVIGALVKNDSTEVINFLLQTEIIPLCLRIMESGTELSKTVAIFIVQKILMDDTGLNYICQTYDRFCAVSSVLSNMVSQLVEAPASRLLKHVVRCYLRLSDNGRACHALQSILPEPLRDGTFANVLRDDNATKRCLAQLLVNLSEK